MKRRGRLIIVLLGVLVILFTAVSPADAAEIKYYIVGAPVNGQREYLYEIAATTLGNGNRYPEIFALNKDRAQPDGATLTDPLELHPGWILLLPLDAKGTGVHTGPLPVISPVPVVSSPAGTPSDAASVQVMGSGGGRSTSGAGSMLVRIGSVVVMVLLAALALALVKSSRRRRMPVRVSRAVPNETRTGPEQPPRPPYPRASTVSAQPLSASSFPMRQPGPYTEMAEGGFPELDDEVEMDGHVLGISLVGARTAATGPAWRQLEPDDEAPRDGAVPIVLGDAGQRRLYLDLTRTPDVVTVIGSTVEQEWFAATVTRQLDLLGLNVAVLDGAVRAGPPVSAGPDGRIVMLTGKDDAVAFAGVVFCAGLHGTDLREARELLAGSGGRAVPVVVGGSRRARWTLRIGRSADHVDVGRPIN